VDARERVTRAEELLAAVEELPDPAARELALDALQAILDLYGEGLARIAERTNGELAAMAEDDELVAHLLLLHGLHPVTLDERVRGALTEVRPYLQSHGGDVDLLGIDDGTVRLRLQGSCSGCPSSTMTLKLAIERAIHQAAPDVAGIEAENAPAPAGGDLLQIEPGPGWSMAGGLPELRSGRPVLKTVSGEPVLFLRADEQTYAYRPACAGCGASLEGATLVGRELTCAACGARYDVRRAGRPLSGAGEHLRPVPLLEDAAGMVRVAL
jgi:Fe-S cluster biogenesis protein NfuA